MAKLQTKEKLFDNSDLNGSFQLIFNHGLNTETIIVRWYDNLGFERLTSDLLQIVDENNIILNCNGLIEGTNRLLLLYEYAGASDPLNDLILSFEGQQEIKKMSENNEDLYNVIAAEVESYELDKLLGYAFYQAISESPEDFDDLLNGSTFEDRHRHIVKHRGLRYVIAYLNYAKYIGESYVADTFTGFVQKNRQDSERISSGDIKRLQLENREIAFNAFALIRDYININPTLYPLWNKRTSDVKTYIPKFYGVKKTCL
jgi:hypothetical protein